MAPDPIKIGDPKGNIDSTLIQIPENIDTEEGIEAFVDEIMAFIDSVSGKK